MVSAQDSLAFILIVVNVLVLSSLQFIILLTKCFNLVINEDFGCLFVLTDHRYCLCNCINLKHNRLKEEKLSLELSAQRFLLSVRWTSFVIAQWCPNATSNLQMSTQTLPEIVAPKACNYFPRSLRSREL